MSHPISAACTDCLLLWPCYYEIDSWVKILFHAIGDHADPSSSFRDLAQPGLSHDWSCAHFHNNQLLLAVSHQYLHVVQHECGKQVETCQQWWPKCGAHGLQPRQGTSINHSQQLEHQSLVVYSPSKPPECCEASGLWFPEQVQRREECKWGRVFATLD